MIGKITRSEDLGEQAWLTVQRRHAAMIARTSRHHHRCVIQTSDFSRRYCTMHGPPELHGPWSDLDDDIALFLYAFITHNPDRWHAFLPPSDIFLALSSPGPRHCCRALYNAHVEQICTVAQASPCSTQPDRLGTCPLDHIIDCIIRPAHGSFVLYFSVFGRP